MTLTPERLAEVLRYDPETGKFFWRVRLAARGPVGAVAGNTSNGKVSIRIDGEPHLAHRLAWLYMTGSWPVNVIDHINCDATDNRFANLREATQRQNTWNMRRSVRNTSGVKGVSWDRERSKWVARIKDTHGRVKQLGRFEQKEQAASAYSDAAVSMRGQFARLA